MVFSINERWYDLNALKNSFLYKSNKVKNKRFLVEIIKYPFAALMAS
jgi:hypothetical protein